MYLYLSMNPAVFEIFLHWLLKHPATHAGCRVCGGDSHTMGVPAAVPLNGNGSSSDDVEAPRDSVTSRVYDTGKPQLAVESTYVDTRTGQAVDVDKVPTLTLLLICTHPNTADLASHSLHVLACMKQMCWPHQLISETGRGKTGTGTAPHSRR